jgi:hypothetical protein
VLGLDPFAPKKTRFRGIIFSYLSPSNVDDGQSTIKARPLTQVSLVVCFQYEDFVGFYRL